MSETVNKFRLSVEERANDWQWRVGIYDANGEFIFIGTGEERTEAVATMYGKRFIRAYKEKYFVPKKLIISEFGFDEEIK